jgi:hypothetical protein
LTQSSRCARSVWKVPWSKSKKLLTNTRFLSELIPISRTRKDRKCNQAEN